MSVFSGCDIATVTKETWYFFHFFQILQILSFHKLLLLFLAGVHGSKSGSIKVCRRWFVPMQRQYGSHKPSRWRKCFVNTLCLSVRWQCHRGEGWMLGGRSYGWWIEGCMKGQREGRYPSGTLSVLVRQVTLQQLQSTSSWSSYLRHLPPLSSFQWQIVLQRNTSIIYPLSLTHVVYEHPSLSIFLSFFACHKFYYEVFKWQVMLRLTALSMTCPGYNRITQEKDPYILRMLT